LTPISYLAQGEKHPAKGMFDSYTGKIRQTKERGGKGKSFKKLLGSGRTNQAKESLFLR